MNLESLAHLKLNSTKSKDLVVTYKGEFFCQIKTEILEKLILDITSSGRINSILKANFVESEVGDSSLEKAINLYFTRKKAYHLGRKITVTKFKKSSPDYVKMKQALAIAENHGVSFAIFLKAQEEELKFVNHGVGTYPTPSHLCTANAENRLISYLAKTKQTATITDYDKKTKYKENRKFQEIFQKIKNKEFDSLQLIDVNYVLKVIEAKQDEVPSEILNAQKAILVRMEE